ncbi:MAG: hypothetical protein WDN25_13860 [Acetobacteraceae bacterium]
MPTSSRRRRTALASGERLLAPAEVGQKGGDVVERAGEVGEEGVAVLAHQVAPQADGLLAGGERLLAPAEVGQPDAEVVERAGEVGEEGVAVLAHQVAVVADGLLAGGERLLAPAEVGQPGAEVVERAGLFRQPCIGGARRQRRGNVLGDDR